MQELTKQPRRTFPHEQALELYQSGKRDPEIARAVGYSREAVRQWRKRNGFLANVSSFGTERQSSVCAPLEERMNALWWDGKTDQQIAETLGIHYKTVRSWRIRHGLDLNPDQRGPKSKWDHERAMELYRAGFLDKDIAREVGAKPGAVSAWRARMNLPSNRAVAKVSGLKAPVDLDRIRDLCGQGLPDLLIAEELGISRNYVAKIRKRLGLPAVRKHADILERDAQMLRLYEQGMSDTELANAIGRSLDLVRKWRKRNGLPVNPAKRAKSAGGAKELDVQRMELYLQGLDDGEIARQLGLARSGIASWRRRNSLPANHPVGGVAAAEALPMPCPVTPDRFYMTSDEILSNWNRCLNPREQVKILAELNAVSVPKMLDKLESLGVYVEPYRKKRAGKLDPEKALELWRQGLDDPAIGRTFGVSASSVRRWRDENGLIPNAGCGRPSK